MATKYNYESLYKDYMTQYNKSMAKAGTAAESPQSLDEFEMNFNSIKKKIKSSKSSRLSGKQIAQKIAREDVYEKSRKQAKAIKKALEEQGFESPSLTAIRAGKVPEEFWSLVKEERQAALERGMTNREANIYISSYIFGSK
jgi:hypothetical protein